MWRQQKLICTFLNTGSKLSKEECLQLKGLLAMNVVKKTSKIDTGEAYPICLKSSIFSLERGSRATREDAEQ